ncbi:MAG: endonuclease [Candidatus Sedimenticola sp. PURPLELP]
MKIRAASVIAAALLTLSGTACKSEGQTAFNEYMEVFPAFWGEVYAKGGETLYCGITFGHKKGRGINIEHVYPMSWAMKAEGCSSRKQCRRTSTRFNRLEADMHNLYPSLSNINKTRGAMAFGTIKGESRRFGKCDFEVDKRSRRVEPRPKSRGNIARAMFYMQETYGLKIFKRQGEMLKQWNRQDPPDAAEHRRNNRIAHIQGSRNRFIDNHKAADRLRF